MADLHAQIRAEAQRALADGWRLKPSPTQPNVVVLTLQCGSQIRGRAETVLALLKGLPEVARA